MVLCGLEDRRDPFWLRGFVLTWGSMMADIPGFSPEIAPYLPTLLLCPLAIGAWLSIRG